MPVYAVMNICQHVCDLGKSCEYVCSPSDSHEPVLRFQSKYSECEIPETRTQDIRPVSGALTSNVLSEDSGQAA